MDTTAEPSVGVVVVTLNAAAHIARCLDSVTRHAIVVVDHGSTDGTVELVRARFPTVTVVEQANRGFAAGVNAGVAAVDATYVLLLNADAWLAAGAVDELVAFAEARPDVAVVGPRLKYPDGSPQVSMRGFPTVWRLVTQYFFLNRLAPRTRLFNAFYCGNLATDRVHEVEFLKGACLLVRRRALDDVGPFDDSFFMFCEEADWSRRARAQGWKTVYVPEAVAYHVGEATTKAVWVWERTFKEQERSHVRFLAKHDGAASAELGRIVIALGYLLRSVFGAPAKRSGYRKTARWLLTRRARRLIAADG